MSTITFDTHVFVKRLIAAGMPEQQAEAVTMLVHDAQEGAELATKADIAHLEASSKTDIARLEAGMRELELRMTIRLGGMLVVITGVLLAAIRYLPAGH